MAELPGRYGSATAALGFVLAAAVGGCATDDPREGGFIGGVMGLVSGQYARSVETKRARLEGLRAEEREFGEDARWLEEERLEQLTAAERRRAVAAALFRQSAELDEQLRRLRRAAVDAELELAEVRSEVDRRDGAPSGLPPPAGGAGSGPAPAEAPPLGDGVAGLLEAAAELEARLGALQQLAVHADGERARLRMEIDRLNEDLTGVPRPASGPEQAAAAPEG